MRPGKSHNTKDHTTRSLCSCLNNYMSVQDWTCSIRCISVSSSQSRKSPDGKRNIPSVVKEPNPRTSQRKQKSLQVPKWFTYQALASGPPITSTAPFQAWSADQRTWLATCLNTVFDNSLVSFAFLNAL